MDGCCLRVGQHRSCSTRSKPFVVVDDDYEDHEEITDTSWRSLILAADRKRTVDRFDCNIFYVVAVRLIGFPCRTPIYTQDIEDDEEDEIGEHRNVNTARENLLVRMFFQGLDFADSRRFQHHSQLPGDDIFKNREAIAKSETCSALALRIESHDKKTCSSEVAFSDIRLGARLYPAFAELIE